MRAIDKLFDRQPPIGNNERNFEIRIFDHGTKQIYAINHKVKCSMLRDDPEGLKTQLLERSKALIETIFRGGNLPVVSTLVVDADPKS